jgi:hypothetical protein
MPIVTLTLRAPKPAAFKRRLLDTIHAALVDIGASPDDRFHRVLELPADGFHFHHRRAAACRSLEGGRRCASQ